MNITERRPFSPGEILKEEFIDPYGLTQDELAMLIGVTRRRINEIVNGRRAISPDTACRLAKLFRMSPEYWMNLQIKSDLWKELHNAKRKKELLKIKPMKIAA